MGYYLWASVLGGLEVLITFGSVLSWAQGVAVVLHPGVQEDGPWGWHGGPRTSVEGE
jgi:hypothetical protein